jgi:hypothetical protein
VGIKLDRERCFAVNVFLVREIDSNLDPQKNDRARLLVANECDSELLPRLGGDVINVSGEAP